jgi:hypothetical protein
LLVASSDGNTTRTLFTRSTPSLNSIDAIGWARNGKTIAFAAANGLGTNSPFSVYVVGSSGRGFKRVRRQAFDPNWSPDGSELVFPTNYRRSNNTALEVVNSQGRSCGGSTYHPGTIQSPPGSPTVMDSAISPGICLESVFSMNGGTAQAKRLYLEIKLFVRFGQGPLAVCKDLFRTAPSRLSRGDRRRCSAARPSIGQLAS